MDLRSPLIVASIVCSLVLSPWSLAVAGQAKKSGSSKRMGLSIRVEGGGWGRAGKDEIEAVLYSVADELLTRVPGKLATPIVVTHTDRNPVALYDKGPGGEYQVHLHAADRHWHEYVYEFAHELCHILSNYEEHVGADAHSYNQWFEETLCETASLHTLNALATTWASAPPDAPLGASAAQLRRFAEQIISEGHRRLPANTPLAAWLRENEEQLRRNPYLRARNEVVANLLLPLFEANPDNVDALSYLNLDPADARNNLQKYLHNWYENAPPEHTVFIANVLTLLGLGGVEVAGASAGANAVPPATAAASGTEPSGHAGPVHK